MTETRYSPATQTPVSSEAGGAIVPASTSSIDRYAQDVYLSLPKDRRTPENWQEISDLAAEGGWEQLQAIHQYFTSNSSVQVSDNSTHSQSYDNRSSALTYTDDRAYDNSSSLTYTDDRTWTTNDTDYQYRTESNLTYSPTTSESWVVTDDRTWTDGRQYSHTYAPEVYNYYNDNSISLNIFDSFNGNGNSNSRTHQLPAGRSGDSNPDSWDRILQLLCCALICILAGGIWRAVAPLPIEAPAPIWQQETR